MLHDCMFAGLPVSCRFAGVASWQDAKVAARYFDGSNLWSGRGEDEFYGVVGWLPVFEKWLESALPTCDSGPGDNGPWNV